jgi:hypothetical protein
MKNVPKNDMDIVFSSISNALGNHVLRLRTLKYIIPRSFRPTGTLYGTII